MKVPTTLPAVTVSFGPTMRSVKASFAFSSTECLSAIQRCLLLRNRFRGQLDSTRLREEILSPVQHPLRRSDSIQTEIPATLRLNRSPSLLVRQHALVAIDLRPSFLLSYDHSRWIARHERGWPLLCQKVTGCLRKLDRTSRSKAPSTMAARGSPYGTRRRIRRRVA